MARHTLAFSDRHSSCSSARRCCTVLAYPKVVGLLPLAERVDPAARSAAGSARSCNSSATTAVTSGCSAFRQNLTQMGTLFAVLLGTGGLLPSGSRDTALFTMSLPASRNELLGSRAATGLLELAVLAFAPALVFPLLSPAVGQTFSVGSAIVHGACLFITWAVFFSLALLLSTVVAGIWIPAVVAICVGFFLMAVDLVAGGTGRFNIFAVMSGEHYFRTGALPWVGLAVSGAASAAMLSPARGTSHARTSERRDDTVTAICRRFRDGVPVRARPAASRRASLCRSRPTSGPPAAPPD